MEALSIPGPADPRDMLQARAQRLASWGLGWHVIEAVVSLAAGIVASSIALVSFGADSVVEVIAAVILLWRFGTSKAGAERRAQQLIAISFVAIAVYVGVEA